MNAAAFFDGRLNKFFLPVMYGCPAARAVVDPHSEDTEEEEEAGHAKAHLVHSSVSNQSFAVFSCIHCLAKLSVEGDLIGGKKPTQNPQNTQIRSSCHVSEKQPTSAHVCLVWGLGERAQ